MKGIVLALLGLLIVVKSSLGAETGTDFGLAVNSPLVNTRPIVSVPIIERSRPTGQFITDGRSEQRGSRPVVAYTLFRFESRFAEVSVQPILGRLNGAQLYVSF